MKLNNKQIKTIANELVAARNNIHNKGNEQFKIIMKLLEETEELYIDFIKVIKEANKIEMEIAEAKIILSKILDKGINELLETLTADEYEAARNVADETTCEILDKIASIITSR